MLEIARRLDGADIAYMVTGSMALAAYSTPRMTRDLDFVIEVGPEDSNRLASLFEHDCYVDRDAVREAIRNQSIFNIIHNKWILKADFVIRKDEPYRLKEFDRRRCIKIHGQQIAFVSPEDLILSKLCWARMSPSELQERDVADLLATVMDLDREYLVAWATQLEVADDLERLAK